MPAGCDFPCAAMDLVNYQVQESGQIYTNIGLSVEQGGSKIIYNKRKKRWNQ